MSPLLDIRDLSVVMRASGRAILRNLSLTLAAGETLGIVGESGCGKSTLLTAMMGGLKPGLEARGQISLAGQDLVAATPEAVRRLCGRQVALVPQNAAVTMTPSMTVGAHLDEQLAFKTGLAPRDRRKRALDLLAALNLPDPAAMLARYPHQLSGGQQQRIGIALALAGNPALLLLDEPTTALDVTTKESILDLLRGLADREGFAMVYVSHDIGVIARMSERIGVMYAGELIEVGPAADTLSRPRHPYAEGLLASVPRITAPGLPRAMPGKPPAPTTARAGCAFAERCALADDRCRRERPYLHPEGATLVACHHPIASADRAREGLRQLKVAAPGSDGALLTLDGIEIAWARAGLIDRLRGRPSSPTATDISFSLAPGEVLGLIGESGSGKSTILRAIGGLWPARAGQILFEGTPLAGNILQRSADQRRQIQIIFQNPEDSLNPRQTVEEILTRPLVWYRALKGAPLQAELNRLIDSVRLPQSHLARLPGTLSGGEKQRVAIARALAASPRLLLCDEITSALDVSVQAAILDLLADLRAETGTAMLFVTHDLAVVRHLADRLIILKSGRIVETGKTTEVMALPSHSYTTGLLNSAKGSDLGFSNPARQ